jgi:hypothetical protein
MVAECYRIVRNFAAQQDLAIQLREGELTGDGLQCLAGALRFEIAEKWLGMKGFVTDGGYVGAAHPYVEVDDVCLYSWWGT